MPDPATRQAQTYPPGSLFTNVYYVPALYPPPTSCTCPFHRPRMAVNWNVVPPELMARMLSNYTTEYADPKLC